MIKAVFKLSEQDKTKAKLKQFTIGQSSLEVCKTIVNNHKEITEIKLISHKVDNNWRQVNESPSAKMKNLLRGFEHERPIQKVVYTRKEFLDLDLAALKNQKSNEVWSMTSKVLCNNNKNKHIPMMNFHPEGVSLQAIKQTLKYICPNHRGCLLNSGRFFHYYGDFLLDNDDWIKFMAKFLMPCIVVSPRYIGHRLLDGYCTLRLTVEKSYKPTIPKVIEIL